MANINLLPWRDEHRQEKQKQFLTALGLFSLLVALLCYVWVSVINGQIDNQNKRNQILKNEIRVLDKRVAEIQELKQRRTELVDRMKVIQGLQGERPVIVRYFDDLVRVVPEGVYLTKLARSGARVEVSGVTESNIRVSEMMRKLDASPWFQSPNLSDVTSAPELGEEASTFELSFQPTKPPETSEDEGV